MSGNFRVSGEWSPSWGLETKVKTKLLLLLLLFIIVIIIQQQYQAPV